ncbi:hypothetical protein HF086_001625 [Spodoptera exigua]|uniref:Uncharacterized protein n=1 Tax=Spodoptera exigua TaxID=7107 RepID=A0A922MPJ6_SPOEX|nr:hypothetical protein HF086_001625 [Spodoptera exigua]
MVAEIIFELLCKSIPQSYGRGGRIQRNIPWHIVLEDVAVEGTCHEFGGLLRGEYTKTRTEYPVPNPYAGREVFPCKLGVVRQRVTNTDEPKGFGIDLRQCPNHQHQSQEAPDP